MTIGLRAGESIQDYTKRLEAALLASTKTASPKFGLSEKGVFTYKAGGQGFPASLSPAQARAIISDTAFHAFVEENFDKATELRKARMETEEYKTQAAKLSESRKAYTLAKQA